MPKRRSHSRRASVRSQPQPIVAVGQQDEVVAGALAFGEREAGAGRGSELSQLRQLSQGVHAHDLAGYFGSVLVGECASALARASASGDAGVQPPPRASIDRARVAS